MSDTNSPLQVRVERGLARVTLAGDHANAIDPPLVAGLRRVLRAIEPDPGARAVVLRAEGKLFCPGLDLQDLLPLDRAAMGSFMRDFAACVLELYAYPKPVLAAIHGHAVAGGFVLALTADWRLLRRGALLGLNEVKVGVPLPFGVAQILRESILPNRIEEVALLGRNFRDESALAAGLAHELVEPEAFEAAVVERAEEFASKDAAALAVTKRYLRAAAVERIRAHDAAKLEEWLDGWFSPATRARIEEIVAGLGGGKS